MERRSAQDEPRKSSLTSPKKALTVLAKKGSFTSALSAKQASTHYLKEVDKKAMLDEDNEDKTKACDQREFQDWKDVSRHPSYTDFKLPYHIKCRERYVRARKMYEEQFQREIAQLLEQQGSAYEAARFQRHMSISTLWPPLHNRREIDTVQRSFIRLNRKQRKHLDLIMSTNIV